MEINGKYADEALGMCICMTCPSWVNRTRREHIASQALEKVRALRKKRPVSVADARHTKKRI